MQRFIASLLIASLIVSLATGHSAAKLIPTSFAVEVHGDLVAPPGDAPSQGHDLRTSSDAAGTVLNRTGPRCRVISRGESSKVAFIHPTELLFREVTLRGSAQDLNTKDFPSSLAHLRLRI